MDNDKVTIHCPKYEFKVDLDQEAVLNYEDLRVLCKQASDKVTEYIEDKFAALLTLPPDTWDTSVILSVSSRKESTKPEPIGASETQ